MRKRRYVFGVTRIWDGANTIDTAKSQKRIGAKSEDKARKKLPDPGFGRKWILIRVEDVAL